MKKAGRLLRVAAAVGGLVTAGCDGFVGVIAVSPNGVVLVVIDPPVVTGQSYTGSGCPGYAASMANFQLGIRSPSEDLSIQSVTMRFRDAFGAAGSPITYSSSEILRSAGDPVVPRGGSRNLGFSVPYGCSPPNPTSLSAHVTMVSRSGATVESEAVASIR